MKSFISITAVAAAIAFQASASDLQEFTPVSNGNMLECMACTAGVKKVSSFFEEVNVKDDIFTVAKLGCEFYAKFIGKEKIHCANFIDMMGPILWPIVFDELLGKERFCDETLKVCSKPGIQEIDLHKVVDDLLATKPDIT